MLLINWLPEIFMEFTEPQKTNVEGMLINLMNPVIDKFQSPIIESSDNHFSRAKKPND